MNFKEIGKRVGETHTMQMHTLKDRVLQLDVDFLCYAYDPEKFSLAQSFKMMLGSIEKKRKRARAALVNACVTLGEKSGRELMATTQPYQDKRKQKTQQQLVRNHRAKELRQMLVNWPRIANINVCYDLMLEADDLLVRLHHTRIKSHGIENSVLESGDKDLWMAQGKFIDPDMGTIDTTRGYGTVGFREVGNTKPKLVGRGRCWFWHQMIMGDKVDNIPAIGRLSNDTMDVYAPLASRKRRKVGDVSCGQSKALMILAGVNTDSVAAHRVYTAYHQQHGVRAPELFIEQAYLLWMQRNNNPRDILNYLAMCGLHITPTKKQNDTFDIIIAKRNAACAMEDTHETTYH